MKDLPVFVYSDIGIWLQCYTPLSRDERVPANYIMISGTLNPLFERVVLNKNEIPTITKFQLLPTPGLG